MSDDQIPDQNLQQQETKPSEIAPTDPENPPQEENIEEFPGYSDFKKCCCCTKMSNGALFCGHWYCAPGMPIFVVTQALANLGILYWIPFFNLQIYGKIFIPIITVFGIMFIFCYLKTIYDGPGYIPFYYYWAINDKLPPNNEILVDTLEDSYYGVITNDTQYKRAHDNPTPGRCIVSKLAKRFVIRPDHFCGWVGSWIGKRNHKMFFCFNFWGSIYLSLSAMAHLAGTVIILLDGMNYRVFVEFVFVIFALMYAAMTMQFAYSVWNNAKKNITSWEEWNNIKYGFEQETESDNIADLFGPDHRWWKVILPINPWKNMSNADLIKDYPTYQQIKSNQALLHTD